MRRRQSAFLVLVLILVACGGSTPATGPIASREAPSKKTLAFVPADTPYVFAALDGAHAEAWEPAMGDVYNSIASIGGDDSPRAPVLEQLLVEMRDGERIRAATELGLAPKAKFVLYGLSIWPVLRVEIADPVKLRGVASRVFAAGGASVRERSRGGARYWTMAHEKVSSIAAVLERELVMAVMPSTELERVIPLLLGLERPARSLAEGRTIDTLTKRHGFLRDWFGYIDARRALELLAGGGSALEQDLGALWRDDAAELAACKGDLARIVRAFPRIVLGYTRLDARGIEGALVIEAPALGAALQAMRTEVPDLVTTRRPLFTMAIGIDMAKLVEWLRASGEALRSAPFTCPGLAELSVAGGKLADGLAGIPPMFLGMRALAFAVDDVTPPPYRGTGAAVLVGDHLPMLVNLMWSSVPQLANVPTPALGIPVALPLRQLGIDNVTSAHVAVGSDRLALAVGDDSEARVRRTLTAGAATRSALVAITFDLVRAAALGMLDNTKAADRANIERLETAGFTIDADARGISIGFLGTLKAPARR